MSQFSTNMAPEFYQERNIPKVRWMFPGKSYKARFKQISYKYPEGIMFIYVANPRHVIAFKDETMTQEIGMLQLEHFEKIKDLARTAPPHFQSTSPISLTYSGLIDKLKQLDQVVQVTILPPDPPAKQEQLSLF